MISSRDIERWFSSSHFRRKCDWVCLDQPKVMATWGDRSSVRQVMLAEGVSLPSWATSAPIVSMPFEWFKTVTKKPSHPGIMVVVSRTMASSDISTHSRVLILDGIQDPGNMGTIIRTMAAFGVSALCVTKYCVDIWHPKSISAAAGAFNHVTYYNAPDWMDWLSTTSRPILALDPHAIQPFHQIKKTTDFVLICGGEGPGLQWPGLASLPISRMSIPMVNSVESLNAGISVAIALHHFCCNNE
ncbi:MAG: TrmH family RNA methyltransferase [Candidatus Marinamargulisbacteria bacterium]